MLALPKLALAVAVSLALLLSIFALPFGWVASSQTIAGFGDTAAEYGPFKASSTTTSGGKKTVNIDGYTGSHGVCKSASRRLLAAETPEAPTPAPTLALLVTAETPAPTPEPSCTFAKVDDDDAEGTSCNDYCTNLKCRSGEMYSYDCVCKAQRVVVAGECDSRNGGPPMCRVPVPTPAPPTPVPPTPPPTPAPTPAACTFAKGDSAACSTFCSNNGCDSGTLYNEYNCRCSGTCTNDRCNVPFASPTPGPGFDDDDTSGSSGTAGAALNSEMCSAGGGRKGAAGASITMLLALLGSAGLVTKALSTVQKPTAEKTLLLANSGVLALASILGYGAVGGFSGVHHALAAAGGTVYHYTAGFMMMVLACLFATVGAGISAYCANLPSTSGGGSVGDTELAGALMQDSDYANLE